MSKLIVNEIEKYDAGQLTITTGTNVSVGSNLTVGGTINGTLSTAAQPNITSVGTLSSLAVTGNLTVDTNTLFVDAANNRVGVGTSSPTHKLSLSTTGADGIKLGVDGQTYYHIVRPNGDGLYIGADDGNTGGSSDIRFNIKGSERMRIDSSGNVGIGTSVADVTGFGWNTLTIKGGASAGDAGVLELQSPTTNANGQNLGLIAFLDGSSRSAQIGAKRESSTTTGYLDFFTNGGSGLVERMRITSGGDVLVGWTGGEFNDAAFNAVNGVSLRPDGTITAATEGIVMYLNNIGGGNVINFNYAASVGAKPVSTVGSISTTSTSTAYNTSSDYRLKENVVPMEGALERVGQLQPSRFNFIADPETTVDGFLAHQVQEVVPEAITGQKDEVEEYEITPAVLDDEGNVVEEAVMGTRPVYQGIDQSKIVPLLVGAIQELKAEIETLKSQINP